MVPSFVLYGLVGMVVAVILLWVALPMLAGELVVSLAVSGFLMIGGYYLARRILPPRGLGVTVGQHTH